MANAVNLDTLPVPRPGKNKYLVWNGDTGIFDSFPIRLGETVTGRFVNIEIAPPILAEGFLSYKKEVFKVPLRDLLRNHINVSNPYSNISRPVTGLTAGSITPVGGAPSGSSNESAASDLAEGEICQEHDIYWAEQMQSLFHNED